MAYKILAIDDHPETLDIVVATLRSSGYEVVGTRNPVKGLSMAEKINPDLVLVDMNMPEMDGKEVCRHLRAHPRLANVPIIMFTAEAEPIQKMEGFDAGADDYLTKPTEPQEMIARIESMLSSIGKPPQGGAAGTPTPPEPVPVPDATVDEPVEFEALLSDLPPAASRTVSLPIQEKLVAVAGVRGGAGATTMAINLAMMSAMSGKDTTLVDFDMKQGHVAMYLNQHIPGGGLNGVARLPHTALRDQLQRLFVPYSDNLKLLLSRPNLLGNEPVLSSSQAVGVIEYLIQPGKQLVVDIGRGVSEMTRPILDHADHVVVCVRPERVALAAAKTFLSELRDALFAHTTLSAVVFSVGASINLPQEAIQNFLGHPLLGVVSVDLKIMARSTNKGVPFVKMMPDSEVARLVRGMTNKMILK